ncbi:MAG: peptide chain release factor 2 [Candidatus Omnitrophica bacterium]|nr:peptide chain release factor 2 [Candidatus Omnitrophota bacterium]
MSAEILNRLQDLSVRLKEVRGYLDLDTSSKRIGELESEIASPDFWNRGSRAQEAISELKALKSRVTPFQKIDKSLTELKDLAALTGDDPAILEELSGEVDRLQKDLKELETTLLFRRTEDEENAVLSLNSGAGGTESCDWAAMLLRMYVRWAQSKGYEVEEVDSLPGEEAGLKNATLIVKGEWAYGRLKSENGVHRLVRISPFDSNKRRHTSFASVDVIPEERKDIEIVINPSDLRIDTFRAGGHGGQHVNVTDSAVRITHLPTGLVAQCQNERSQHKNKTSAMRVLRARVYEYELKKREDRLAKHYGNKMEIAWGSQIRSYVLHPYNMVKDHRTQVETSNAQVVLDGDLDAFLEGYLKYDAAKAADKKSKKGSG